MIARPGRPPTVEQWQQVAAASHRQQKKGRPGSLPAGPDSSITNQSSISNHQSPINRRSAIGNQSPISNRQSNRRSAIANHHYDRQSAIAKRH
jgi:hypothetical protein